MVQDLKHSKKLKAFIKYQISNVSVADITARKMELSYSKWTLHSDLIVKVEFWYWKKVWKFSIWLLKLEISTKKDRSECKNVLVLKLWLMEFTKGIREQVWLKILSCRKSLDRKCRLTIQFENKSIARLHTRFVIQMTRRLDTAWGKETTV